jgi:hypothetical protein
MIEWTENLSRRLEGLIEGWVMLNEVDRILTGLWRLLRSLRVVYLHGGLCHQKQDCSLMSACMEERDCVCGKHENPPNEFTGRRRRSRSRRIADLLHCCQRLPRTHDLYYVYGLYLSSKSNTNDLNRIERAALQMIQVFNLDTIA